MRRGGSQKAEAFVGDFQITRPGFGRLPVATLLPRIVVFVSIVFAHNCRRIIESWKMPR
jgi:hypothetical protein